MLEEIINELKKFGNAQTKKIFLNHGCDTNLFGVKIGDLNKIIKKFKLKKDDQVLFELLNTEIMDAKILALKLIDPKLITFEYAEKLLNESKYYMYNEYYLSPLIAKTDFGLKFANKYFKSNNDTFKACSYAIYANMILNENKDITLDFIIQKFNDIKENITKKYKHFNRAKYQMVSFIIASGLKFDQIKNEAISFYDIFKNIIIDYGNTNCKIPDIKKYLIKK